MVNFACKTISKEDIIRCSFGLSKTEYNILLLLIENDATIRQISDEMDLDRTTVQKAISSLFEKNIIIRKKIIYKKGYAYCYSVENKKQLKKNLEEIMEKWYGAVKKEIKKL